MATRMILVQYFMLFLHGINLIYAYNVSRSIGASTSNGFYTSKDSFRNTEQSKKCNHFNAKCIQSRISDNGSIRCSVCDCGKRKTFLSYSHGCMNNTDLYKAIGGRSYLLPLTPRPDHPPPPFRVLFRNAGYG